MLIYLYYTIVTVALAGVDAIRIRQVAGKVANIKHWISTMLAAGTAVIIWMLCTPVFNWTTALIAAGFIAIRALLYDPALNLMRGLPIAYESNTTSSYIDNHWPHVSFLARRLIAAGIIALVLLTHYLFIR